MKPTEFKQSCEVDSILNLAATVTIAMTRNDQEGRVLKIEAADPCEVIENVGKFSLFGSAGVVLAGLRELDIAK